MKQLNKLECKNILTSAKVIFVNFLAEDYKAFLRKLVSLTDLYNNTLRAVIINMPPDCQVIDPYFAKLLCHLCFQKGGELQVFFIRADDKYELLSKVFKRDAKTYTQLTKVKLTTSLIEGTLVYIWGSAHNGKLGLG